MKGQGRPQQDAEELGANGQEGAARRWSPPPLLYASAAVHLGAAAAALARPRLWPWALGALAANHVALAAAGLWPRSQLLGANWVRLPARNGVATGVAITIDDGPDPDVTPQVLSQLAEHRALATFFCVGARVERYADLAREIVRRGHAIENHSQRHRHNFSLLGPGGMSAEISCAGGAAQSVSRPRAHPPAAAPCQLDAPRLRHRQYEPGCRVPAPGESAAGRRHLAAARWQCGTRPRRQAGDPGGPAAAARRPGVD